MTKFEQHLISVGYVKHIYNCKTGKLELTNKHTLSTLENLDHRYIKGEREIVFGLHEQGKPSTLIYPRPRIKVDRNGVTINESFDDAMNIILSKFTPAEILEAMYDKQIVLTC